MNIVHFVTCAIFLVVNHPALAESFGDAVARCVVKYNLAENHPGLNDAFLKCNKEVEAQRATSYRDHYVATNDDFSTQARLSREASASLEAKAEANRIARRTGVQVDNWQNSEKEIQIGEAGFDRLWKNNKQQTNSSESNQNSIFRTAFSYAFAAAIVASIIGVVRAKAWRLVPNISTIIARIDTRTKRIAILAFPFFTVVSIYKFVQDSDRNQWEPSLSFLMFAMASVLCLLIAFTKVGDWMQGQKP